MITNLVATISMCLVTNWSTTSMTREVINDETRFDLVWRPPIINQTGIVQLQTIATIEHKGVKIPVVLESTEVRREYRSITAIETLDGQIKTTIINKPQVSITPISTK